MNNLKNIKRNLIFDKNISIPCVYSQYCNKETLVISFANGTSLRKVIYETHNVNRRSIATNIVQTYLNQVYRDGLFHADMHSGNIIVEEKSNKITLIDFGIVSSISKHDRRAVATIIYAFLHNRYDLVLTTQLYAGYISEKVFLNEGYRNAMRNLTTLFQKDFSMSAFTQELFLTMNRFNILVPKHLLLLNKTIIYIEDIAKQLDKNFNPFLIITPWIRKWYYKERILMMLERIYNTKAYP